MQRRRLELGLGATDLAKLLGVAATSVANWEKGRTEPAIAHLPRIIQFLGYDPDAGSSHLGTALRHRRGLLGLSQEATARHLRVDPGTIRRWERGVREPVGKLRCRALAFLGWPDQGATAATLSERLRRYRHGLGLSQRQVARKLDMRPSTLAGWETGRSMPGKEATAAIERALGQAFKTDME
jgi:transcriptional regulator with XRE-family HTH domain